MCVLCLNVCVVQLKRWCNDDSFKGSFYSFFKCGVFDRYCEHDMSKSVSLLFYFMCVLCSGDDSENDDSCIGLFF